MPPFITRFYCPKQIGDQAWIVWLNISVLGSSLHLRSASHYLLSALFTTTRQTGTFPSALLWRLSLISSPRGVSASFLKENGSNGQQCSLLHGFLLMVAMRFIGTLKTQSPWKWCVMWIFLPHYPFTDSAALFGFIKEVSGSCFRTQSIAFFCGNHRNKAAH